MKPADSPHSLLSQIPWATLGRRESSADFFAKCEGQRARQVLFAGRPRISLVITIPAGVLLSRLQENLAALQLQTYPEWEAILISKSKPTFLCEAEKRLRWVEAPEGQSEVEWKSLGARHATGEWIGFLGAEEILSPAALYQVLFSLQSEKQIDLLYTNEIYIDGKKAPTFFSKPEWSYFSLLHFNYIGHFWFVRKTLFDTLGGLRAEWKTHAEHDFLLRLSERTDRVELLPYFFLYRRGTPRVLPADELAKGMVESHLARKKLPAEVKLDGNLLKVTPTVELPEKKLVSVIVCFRDRADWTIRALQGLREHLGKVPVEVWLVNNQSTDEQLEKIKNALPSFPFPVNIIDYDSPFNFANMHNTAIAKSRGQFLLLLNNDVFWTHGNLDDLVAWAEQPWVGTIGFLLKYPYGGIQHAGFRAVYGGQSRLARIGHVHEDNRFAHENREVFGSTFAACLFRRVVFDLVGGLRELDFPNGYGDVVFNFECLKRSLRNIYLGHIEAVHLESASRGLGDYEYWEEFGLEREYPEILQRMLRFDLGYNRIPEADFSVGSFIRQAVLQRLRESMPWLRPLNMKLKKMLRTASQT